jgi:AraC-like DNA-binding protein/TolB-like protein
MTGAGKNAQDFIGRLTEIIEANLQNEQFGVKELARETGMSRSSLHRKITEVAKMPANQFICQVRLKKALKMLRDTSLTVSETAYECGFHSATYFSKCFRDYYGYSPGKVGNRNETELPAEKDSLQKTEGWEKWLKPAASLILFVLFIFLISESAWFGSSASGKEDKPKTIAMLPLKFEGADSMKILAGGVTEGLLNRLMEIENLVVRSKTSVEQYQETTKPLKEIAKEIKADYVIEINARQHRNNLYFQINIAEAENDTYLLRESYTANIKEEDFLDLQIKMALDIFDKTRIKLAPVKNKQLEQRLTWNPAALRFYLMGLQHLELKLQNETKSNWHECIQETFHAKKAFEKAVQLDSGFSAAYVRLGHIFIDVLSQYFPELKIAYLDSGLVCAEKAISLHKDHKKGGEYCRALRLKSSYLRYQGNIKEARRLSEESMKYIPSSTSQYYILNFSKYCDFDDNYEAIEAFYRYIEMKPGEEIMAPWMYNKFSLVLFYAGFPNVAEKYLEESLNIHLDSLDFYNRLCNGHVFSGNFESCMENVNKGIKINPSHLCFVRHKIISYAFTREFESAFETIMEVKIKNWFPEYYFKTLAGYVYYMNGQPTLADQIFQEVITNRKNEIISGDLNAALFGSHFELAMIYAALDEKDNALNYLREVKNKSTIPLGMIVCMKHYPLFDNIRNEPEFNKLLKDLEGKYQKEHNRIAALLRQKGKYNHKLIIPVVSIPSGTQIKISATNFKLFATEVLCTALIFTGN